MFQLAVCQKWSKHLLDIHLSRPSLGVTTRLPAKWMPGPWDSTHLDISTYLHVSPRISTYLDPFSWRKSLNEGPSHGGAARERSTPYHSRDDCDCCDGCDGRDSCVMFHFLTSSKVTRDEDQEFSIVFHVPQLFLPHSNGFSFVLVCSIQMSHGR